MTRTPAATIASIIGLCLAAAAHADPPDWQWSDQANPGRNMTLPAKGLPVQLTEDNRLWHTDLKAKWNLAQPQIAGDLVLAGCDAKGILDDELRRAAGRGGAVIALDRRTGQPRWQFAAPNKGYANSYGVATAGAVADGRLYVLAGQWIVCLDLAGLANGNDGPFTDELAFYSQLVPEEPIETLSEGYGDIIWLYDLREELRISFHDTSAGTTLVDGDYLWVTTSHQVGNVSPWDPRDAPYVMVLDRATGRPLARDRVSLPIVFHGNWSSLSAGEVDGRKLVFWGDGYGVLHAFERPEGPFPEGEMKDLTEAWYCDLNPPRYRKHPDGSPILYTWHNQLFPKYPQDIEWKKGTMAEHRLLGPCEIIATPVFHDGKVYAAIGRDCYYNSKDGAVNGGLYCIDPTGSGDVTDTHVIWETTEVGRTQCTPSIDADGLMYVADTLGKLVCLEADTGQVRWKGDIADKATSRSQLLADGKIYIANDRHQMYVFQAGETCKLLWEGRVSQQPTTPTAADGVLYLSTRDGVTAYTKNPDPAAEQAQTAPPGETAE